jgi:ribosomal protein S24E
MKNKLIPRETASQERIPFIDQTNMQHSIRTKPTCWYLIFTFQNNMLVSRKNMQVCNIVFSGEHTPTSDQTRVPRRTSWYSRLSAEKKAEYIEKQRNSRQKKKYAGQPQ